MIKTYKDYKLHPHTLAATVSEYQLIISIKMVYHSNITDQIRGHVVFILARRESIRYEKLQKRRVFRNQLFVDVGAGKCTISRSKTCKNSHHGIRVGFPSQIVK